MTFARLRNTALGLPSRCDNRDRDNLAGVAAFHRWAATCGGPHRQPATSGHRSQCDVLHRTRSCPRVDQSRRTTARDISRQVLEMTTIPDPLSSQCRQRPVDWELAGGGLQSHQQLFECCRVDRFHDMTIKARFLRALLVFVLSPAS